MEDGKERKIILKIAMPEKEELVNDGCFKKAEIHQLNQDFYVKTVEPWASVVVQWLRVCLPMQGTRVRALVWEDPTCHGATRPVSHNY